MRAVAQRRRGARPARPTLGSGDSRRRRRRRDAADAARAPAQSLDPVAERVDARLEALLLSDFGIRPASREDSAADANQGPLPSASSTAADHPAQTHGSCPCRHLGRHDGVGIATATAYRVVHRHLLADHQVLQRQPLPRIRDDGIVFDMERGPLWTRSLPSRVSSVTMRRSTSTSTTLPQICCDRATYAWPGASTPKSRPGSRSPARATMGTPQIPTRQIITTARRVTVSSLPRCYRLTTSPPSAARSVTPASVTA